MDTLQGIRFLDDDDKVQFLIQILSEVVDDLGGGLHESDYQKALEGRGIKLGLGKKFSLGHMNFVTSPIMKYDYSAMEQEDMSGMPVMIKAEGSINDRMVSNMERMLRHGFFKRGIIGNVNWDGRVQWCLMWFHNGNLREFRFS